jgi:hypothetical protein
VSVNGPGAAGEGSGGDGAGRVGRAEAQFAAFARAVRGVGEALPSRSFSEAHAGSVESLLRSMGLGFGDESGSA